METRSNYAIVGAVVVALTVAIFFAVLWLSRVSESDNQHFDIFFKQAINGLAGKNDGQKSIFKAIVIENIRKTRGDDGPKPIIG